MTPAPTVRRRLEVAAHGILLLLFIAALSRPWQTERSDSELDRFAPGGAFSLDGIYSRPGIDTYFILILSPTCQYCRHNMVHYANLSQLVKRNEHASVVALLDNAYSKTILRQEFSEYHVNVDTIISIPFAELGVDRVPLTVKVSREGRIEEAWLGALGDKQRAELMKSAIIP